MPGLRRPHKKGVTVPSCTSLGVIVMQPSSRAGSGQHGAGQLSSLLDLHEPRHPALGGSLEAELSLLLGQPWDDELESFRHAGAGAPVRWLNATG